MTDTFAKHLEAQHEAMKAALTELLRITSVCDEEAGGYPFGPAVDQALRAALRIARNLGFRTKYRDGGYYGYATGLRDSDRNDHPGLGGRRDLAGHQQTRSGE